MDVQYSRTPVLSLLIGRCSYEGDYVPQGVQWLEVFSIGLNSEFFMCKYNVPLIKWLVLHKWNESEIRKQIKVRGTKLK